MTDQPIRRTQIEKLIFFGFLLWIAGAFGIANLAVNSPRNAASATVAWPDNIDLISVSLGASLAIGFITLVLTLVATTTPLPPDRASMLGRLSVTSIVLMFVGSFAACAVEYYFYGINPIDLLLGSESRESPEPFALSLTTSSLTLTYLSIVVAIICVISWLRLISEDDNTERPKAES